MPRWGIKQSLRDCSGGWKPPLRSGGIRAAESRCLAPQVGKKMSKLSRFKRKRAADVSRLTMTAILSGKSEPRYLGGYNGRHFLDALLASPGIGWRKDLTPEGCASIPRMD